LSYFFLASDRVMVGYWIAFLFSTDDCLYVKCEFGYPRKIREPAVMGSHTFGKT
jgi:hypothetical protein